MDGFEYKQQDLVSYPLFDWQPVELLEKGGSMIIFGGTVNEFCSPVLKALKSGSIIVAYSKKKSIAIVKARQDERAYEMITCIKVQITANTGDVPEL